MNVIQAIIALLYDHDTVIVPALGAFVRHNEGAQVNVITNEFQKPGSSLGFDPQQREENPLLMETLVRSGEFSEEEARQQIAAFVADSFAKMREGETVALEGLGVLSLNRFQELEFEADPSADFNADAFGLTDLEVPPVFAVNQPKQAHNSPTQVVTTETEQPNLNHPESPAVEENGDDVRTRWIWLWILLVLLLLGGGALWYFGLWPFDHKPVRPEPTIPVLVDTVTPEPVIVEPVEPMGDTLVESVIDTLTEPVPTIEGPGEEPVPTVEPSATEPIHVVRPQPESKAFIVGGVFSEEQNALNMAAEAIEQGCEGAFVMKRGSKFFVCYGQYATGTAAREALPEIVAQYNSKAWILIK